MSKRVSNRKGKGGARSRRTWKRYQAKRAFARQGRPATVPTPVVSPRNIPAPSARSLFNRIVAPVKRFFRSR
jgi:hypothetical protein